MYLLVSEVLKNVSNAKTSKEKIEILRQNDGPALKEILKIAYTPNVKFFVDKCVNYVDDGAPIGHSFSSLFQEYKRLYIFLESTNVKPERKKEILIQILESIHSSEAKLLVDIIEKNMSKYNLNKKLINEAFPGLIV